MTAIMNNTTENLREVNRSVAITVRLTPHEGARVVEAARAEGRSLSNYLRNVALGRPTEDATGI